MIKSENGNIRLSGNTPEILADFTCIIRSLRMALTDIESEEFADATITHCGELAYMTEEERRASLEQMEAEMEDSYV